MDFQGKVLSVLTRLELRVDALTRHVEAQDEQMRQDLAICKATVSARVMATHEGSEDSHTMGGREEVSSSTIRYGKGKVPYTSEDKGKGKQRKFVPRLRCFICDGLHFARECCETPRKSNFLKNGKMIILVKIQNFYRSQMTKQTSPLELSREI